MTRKLVKPNRYGLTPIGKIVRREPLTRELLISKATPFNSYVASRMRELGVYDKGLKPTQIAAVQAELKQVFEVKKGIDQNDVNDAIAKALQIDSQRTLPTETKQLVSDIKKYQIKTLKVLMDKNDANASKVISKNESGTQTGERERLEQPQEALDNPYEQSQRLPEIRTPRRQQPTPAEEGELYAGDIAGTPRSMRTELSEATTAPAGLRRAWDLLSDQEKYFVNSDGDELTTNPEKNTAIRLGAITYRSLVKRGIIDEDEIMRLRDEYRSRQAQRRQKGEGLKKGHSKRLPTAKLDSKLMQPPILNPMSLRINI